jgi:hypothetical protein
MIVIFRQPRETFATPKQSATHDRIAIPANRLFPGNDGSSVGCGDSLLDFISNSVIMS